MDGALFTMNIMNSLNYYNIANCPPSAGFAMDQEVEMRNILEINEGENIVCLIAIGSFRSEYKIAKSPREEIDNIVKIYS